MLFGVHYGNLIASVEILTTFKRRSLGENALRKALKLHASRNVATDTDVAHICFAAAANVVENQLTLVAGERKLRGALAASTPTGGRACLVSFCRKDSNDLVRIRLDDNVLVLDVGEVIAAIFGNDVNDSDRDRHKAPIGGNRRPIVMSMFTSV